MIFHFFIALIDASGRVESVKNSNKKKNTQKYFFSCVFFFYMKKMTIQKTDIKKHYCII